MNLLGVPTRFRIDFRSSVSARRVKATPNSEPEATSLTGDVADGVGKLLAIIGG